MSAGRHIPVLLAETLHWLRPAPGRRYLDGTYGRGGHAAALLEAGAEVLALDLDPRAVDACREEAAGQPLLRCRQGSFREMAGAVAAAGWDRLDGILLDLGVSSPQLDDPAYGFSYRAEAPLDLRFDPQRGRPASALIRELSERELADLIRRYGEERRARAIARAIAARRRESPVETTSQLAAAVAAVVGRREERNAALSRVFQALRIAVNEELAALSEALAAVPGLLAPGGRIVVIAYHSLEDRIVKRWLAQEGRDCLCPPAVPVCRCGHRRTMRVLTRRPVRPGQEELAVNPRARSARLRAGERLP